MHKRWKKNAGHKIIGIDEVEILLSVLDKVTYSVTALYV